MIWDNYRKELTNVYYSQEQQKVLVDTLYMSMNDRIGKDKRSLHTVFGIMVLCTMVLCILCRYTVSPPFINKSENKAQISKELPKIKEPDIRLFIGGLGGLPVLEEPDASHLKTNNPWLIQKQTRLPVYKNGITTDGKDTLLSGGISDSEMQQRVQHYADTFGLHTLRSKNITSQIWFYIYDNGTLEVNRNGTIQLSIDADNAAEKLLVKENTEIQSFEEAEKYSMIYASLFKKQLNLQQPTPAVRVDYGHDFENNKPIPQWEIGLYDKKNNAKEDIHSYNFASYCFHMFSVGDKKQIVIDINTYEVGEMLGEYPLISETQAEVQFHKGEYLTLCPLPIDEIAYMDVVYLFHDSSEYMIPYYRIYAPIDPEKNDMIKITFDGMTAYGVYYICAVESRYLNASMEGDTSLQQNRV